MDSTASSLGAPEPSGGAEDHFSMRGPLPASAAVAEGSTSPAAPSRYESQKRRDWNIFLQYLENHKPPLTLERCSGAHVIEFLKYMDQFGKTKVHVASCPYFGDPNPPAPCTCPLKQAWGSLDALIGRLRAAYEMNGGQQVSNPFGAKAVRIYLREVRESHAKARGIPHEKKRKRSSSSTATAAVTSGGTLSAEANQQVGVNSGGAAGATSAAGDANKEGEGTAAGGGKTVGSTN
ncbi:hypothetical protein SAY86_017795 [Trapa natans]|uniref:ALOG domain-containing protein n=1 Tax=Trapa natans TaxID=22666 RepID=A0AAN7M5R5_TRANT|nr:hypothetical protein SAY86_017795 [Trapa natans]